MRDTSRSSVSSDLITRDLGRRAGADRTMLVLRDGPAGPPSRSVSAWDARPDLEELPRPPLADGFVGRVLESEHSAVEPDAAGAPFVRLTGPPGRSGRASRSATDPGADALGRRVVRPARRALPPRSTRAGRPVAAARRDALTGCLSYGAIRQELIREIRRAARHGRSVSCCFIDLDRFKAVNDHHGHLHGSRVLASVAAALGEGVRDGDSLGRYGGDEFVALLPDTDEAAAFVLAERLRARIAAVEPSGTRQPSMHRSGSRSGCPAPRPRRCWRPPTTLCARRRRAAARSRSRRATFRTDSTACPGHAPGRTE